MPNLVDRLDAVLPQTQCAECGFDGCRPYAEAIAAGRETIEKCPPGGTETLDALAKILNQDPAPYLNEVSANTRAPSFARVVEAECIGCTKCIQACPVDAIIGTGKLMHSVIEIECTGCELCVPACPTDCIELITLPTPSFDKNLARERFNARQARRTDEEARARKEHIEKKKHMAPKRQDKRDYIKEAMERKKNKDVAK